MLEYGSGLDVYYMVYIAGFVASRTQWRFGIFTVRLQIGNQVKS